MFGIILPVFVELISNFQEYFEFRRCSKIIHRNPIKQLVNLGFKKSYSYKNEKGITSLPILVGQVENYPICIEVEKRTIRVIFEIDLDETDHLLNLKKFLVKTR